MKHEVSQVRRRNKKHTIPTGSKIWKRDQKKNETNKACGLSSLTFIRFMLLLGLSRVFFVPFSLFGSVTMKQSGSVNRTKEEERNNNTPHLSSLRDLTSSVDPWLADDWWMMNEAWRMKKGKWSARFLLSSPFIHPSPPLTGRDLWFAFSFFSFSLIRAFFPMHYN